jgi:hypothetical protein
MALIGVAALEKLLQRATIAVKKDFSSHLSDIKPIVRLKRVTY